MRERGKNYERGRKGVMRAAAIRLQHGPDGWQVVFKGRTLATRDCPLAAMLVAIRRRITGLLNRPQKLRPSKAMHGELTQYVALPVQLRRDPDERERYLAASDEEYRRSRWPE